MSSYLKKTPAEKLLYESHEGVYYLRKRDGVSGTDTDICLHTKKKTVAVEARDAYLAARVASKLGIAYNPNRKRVKVSAVLELYEAAQYPDDDGNPREEGNHLRSEKAAIVHLREHFRGYTEEITQGKLDAYKNWRCNKVKKTKTSSGKRTVDLELNTLGNACKWAVRKDLISQNPLEKRKRYHKSSQARHAKNVQPQSVDEFHEICGELFKDPRSQVLGWQALWEGSTGLRTNEVLLLRLDAGPGEPGHVADGGLCIRPSKQKEINPTSYIELRPDLKLLYDAHQAWLKARKKPSPWWFPGCDGQNAAKAVSLGALTKSLDSLFARGRIARKITSHGLRALYVLVRRSNGIPDEQIAAELHQVGGIKTLQESYGQIPRFWLDGRGPRFTWTPAVLAWQNLGVKSATVISTNLSKARTK